MKMSKIECRGICYIALFFLCFIVLPACAQSVTVPFNVDPGNVMNTITEQKFLKYASEAGGYMTQYSKDLFFYLVGIDFIWTGINWVLDETDLQSIIGALVKKVIYIGLMLQLINSMDLGATGGNIMSNKNWVATIPNTFVAIGQEISAGLPNYNCITAGGGPSNTVGIGEMSTLKVNPGCIMDTGIALALTFIGKVIGGMFSSVLSFFTIVPNLILLVFAVIVTIYIVMVFCLLAMDLFVNFIEAYVTMAVGIFLLGFTGSRWTMTTINTYIQYMTMLGLRMLMGIAVFVISWEVIGAQVYGTPGSAAAAIIVGSGWELTIDVLGVTFIMHMVVKEVPNIAAGMASNSTMQTPGNSLKAGLSGLASARQMAAKGMQVTGGVMKGAGGALQDRLQGKSQKDVHEPEAQGGKKDAKPPSHEEEHGGSEVGVAGGGGGGGNSPRGGQAAQNNAVDQTGDRGRGSASSAPDNLGRGAGTQQPSSPPSSGAGGSGGNTGTPSTGGGGAGSSVPPPSHHDEGSAGSGASGGHQPVSVRAGSAGGATLMDDARHAAAKIQNGLQNSSRINNTMALFGSKNERAMNSTVGQVKAAREAGQSVKGTLGVAGRSMGAKEGDGAAKGTARVAGLGAAKLMIAIGGGMQTAGRSIDGTKVDKKNMEKGEDGRMHRKIDPKTGAKHTGGNMMGRAIGGLMKSPGKALPSDTAPANFVATLAMDMPE